MKRYLLFAGPDCYPSGGFGDFVGSYDSLDDALWYGNGSHADWWHVVDIETGFRVDHKDAKPPSQRLTEG